MAEKAINLGGQRILFDMIKNYDVFVDKLYVEQVTHKSAPLPLTLSGTIRGALFRMLHGGKHIVFFEAWQHREFQVLRVETSRYTYEFIDDSFIKTKLDLYHTEKFQWDAVDGSSSNRNKAWHEGKERHYSLIESIDEAVKVLDEHFGTVSL